MLSAKLIALMLSFRALFLGCCPPADRQALPGYQLERYARMPRELRESSGLAHAGGGAFWTLVDGGGEAALFKIASNGQLLERLPLPLHNQDWESLTRSPDGTLYIGDFGNNLNQRRNLRIFKVDPLSQQIDTISFYWADQQAFPPSKKGMNYDCEAFFWYQGRLHLFTKARGDKRVQHYSLPDTAGSYAAQPLESAYVNDLVTGADISPDGRTLALLTYGKVYLFAVQGPEHMLQQPISCLRLPWTGQAEAILFLSNSSLLVGNELGRMHYLQL
ncbi:esterase-like activity of phytase family protein [Cesiribacter andamanensis]|uniref:Uncharacterized protein n=1 Tax=Cesiribacter andamanensis AMV16 TaxID=1279009 RepID=M7P133_9BACT|nr:hypothetical protein [Cesiribacter andamanensis]EMR04284.1 hypothetical protein ADICEAN_00570 [Cesiribacter andamanensis AMV16]